MYSKENDHLIQYFEAELEKFAPRGVETTNPYLTTIGEMVVMLTENSDVIDDGSKRSAHWSDQNQDTQRVVYFHEKTGWTVLLSWIGHNGVEGHTLEYFNPLYLNPGFTRKRDFNGQMEQVAIYQSWAMDEERPFWDLYEALVVTGENLPRIEETGYKNIIEKLELGLATLL